ncbi:uncharacterized protein LOC144441142 isoform X2 [Glandiceps talaboti]
MGTIEERYYTEREVTFVCDICDVEYLSSDSVQRHIRQHLDFKKCKADVMTPVQEDNVHTHTDNVKAVEERYYTDREGTFVCDICDVEYLSSDSVQRHIRQHLDFKKCKADVMTPVQEDNVHTHTDNVKAVEERYYTEREGTFVCDICDVEYLSSDSVQRHIRQHVDFKSDMLYQDTKVEIDRYEYPDLDDNLSENTPSSADESVKEGTNSGSTHNEDDAMKQRCKCKNDCISKVGMAKIKQCRHDLCSRNATQQGQFILDAMKFSHVHGEKQQFMFIVAGTKVCTLGWRLIYGISKSRFYDYQKKFLNGALKNIHGNTGMLRSRVEVNLAKAWLTNYVALMGDKMPNTDQIHLPSSMTKIHVYTDYLADTRQPQSQKISQSSFYELWSKEFNHVRIPKENRFAKCTVCDDLKRASHVKNDVNEKKAIVMDLKEHYLHQKKQRESYYNNIMRAKAQPDDYLSVIIDGMEQNCSNLPHFPKKTKENSTLWKLKTHLTGVLVHSEDLKLVFIDCNQWPHDSNLTCTILMNVFDIVSKRHGGNLPPVLYLQMDNSWRECKNRNILGFLAYLLKLGIFREVQIGYLMQGHTHEDADQMFSTISRTLKKKEAMTMGGLESLIEESFNGATCLQLKTMFDIKKHIGKHINNIHHHSGPHNFKLKVCTRGVVILYKDWMSGNSWVEVNEPIMESIPQSPLIEMVIPNFFELKLTDVVKTVNGLYKSGKIKEHEVEEWKTFVHDLRNAEHETCPIKEFKQWNEGQRKKRQLNTREEEERVNKLYRSLEKTKKLLKPHIKKKRQK